MKTLLLFIHLHVILNLSDLLFSVEHKKWISLHELYGSHVWYICFCIHLQLSYFNVIEKSEQIIFKISIKERKLSTIQKMLGCFNVWVHNGQNNSLNLGSFLTQTWVEKQPSIFFFGKTYLLLYMVIMFRWLSL